MTANHARFDGRQAWARLTELEKEEIGALALEYIVAWNGMDANESTTMTPLLRAFERADCLLGDMLHNKVAIALADAVPSLNTETEPVPLPSLLGPVCRVCGCTEYDPCEDVCGWAEPDLCTSCAGEDAVSSPPDPASLSEAPPAHSS